MSEIIEKVKSAIKRLETEKGQLLICALFLRADALEKWDIVLAASWLNPKEMLSYEILSSCLQNFLTPSDLVQFSRIVILEQDDPIVSFLLNLETVKNGGYKELSADILTEKFRFTIKKAYLLRSQKSEV
ncbi:MAG: hypothetical protein KGI80_02760 [Verrucomicrobiota bacterium]|nr:hypothetical protein [Verrucomicrobiota bacterium]